MFIYLAIFCNSTIRYSSIRRLPGGPFSELELLVVVSALESLLFLKIRRMMLLIVLMALLILWFFSTSSHSWKMWTRYFVDSFFPLLPFLVRLFCLPSSPSMPFLWEVELIVVEVAGFVLRDPFDSPGRIPVPLYGELNFYFWTFSPRPRTFIVEDGF